jgi:hypothetical protein
MIVCARESPARGPDRLLWVALTRPPRHHGMTAFCVRREKAALSSGCKSHPANAPAGSNRSSHGGDEMATISTTSNSSRRNFIQGSGARARIGDRSESLRTATTKLEKLAVTARHPLCWRQWNRWGPISSSASCYQSEPLRDCPSANRAARSWPGRRRLDGWVPA